MPETESNVGKPFNFDAASWLPNRSVGESVSIDPIEEDDVMTQAKSRISALLDGELPEEVFKMVEIKAAERGQQTGLEGPAARNLTFRDLGRSAMEGITLGIQASQQNEALRLEREKINKSMELDSARLTEEIRQANDRFAAAMVDSDLRAAGVGLEAIRLQSMNKQFRLSEENRLIIANSQNEIGNLQQNMDSMGDAFLSFNTTLQDYVNLYS